MKKEKTSVNRYLEIINKTKSCIVINSLKLVLKPQGESGDSVIVDEAKTMDNDVIGLQSADLIEISAPVVKKIKKQKDDSLITEKKPKVAVNDKKGSRVIYVDHGKVKKGKMARSIQDLHMIDPSGNNEKDVEEDEDKHSDAFVDPK